MEEDLTRPSSVDVISLFNEYFPYYLAMGMTYDQFWNGDPSMTRAYRKAQEIRRQWENENAWLHGMYIYEALCDVSPVLHAFAKRGTRPAAYANEPYPITKREKELKEAREEKERQARYKEYLKRFAKAFNANFRKEAKDGVNADDRQTANRDHDELGQSQEVT